MAATDRDPVLELGARFYAAQRERPASVRIDGLVQQERIERGCDVGADAWTPDDQPQDVDRGVSEETCPALLWGALAQSAELAPERREERTADDEGDESSRIRFCTGASR